MPIVYDVIPLKRWDGRARAAVISRLNGRLAPILAIFLTLIAVPFGANNSLSWLVAALFLTLLCAVYMGAVAHYDPLRPSALRQYRLSLALGALVILSAMAQLLPHDLLRLPDVAAGAPPRLGTMTRPATELAVLRLISYAALFILVVECCHNRRRAVQMLRWIYAGVVLHAIWALISLSVLQDQLLFTEKVAYHGMATGTFINRNSFATYLAMGATVGTGLMWVALLRPTQRSARRRRMPTSVALQLGGLVVVLATLAATGSRMGALVGCLGVGSVSALMLYQHRVALWRIGLGTLAGLLVLIAGAVLSGQSVTVERLFFALAEGEARPELFRQTWQMIAANPWWGYGVDSYPLAFELYRSEGLRPDLTWQAPHNTYLTLWVEYGVGFGSVTLLLVATLLYWVVQGLNGAERDILPAAIATAVIALTAVHALVDFSLEIAANTYLFVALVALGLPSGARGDA